VRPARLVHRALLDQHAQALMEVGGLLYLCDSYADDLPYWIKARGSKPHLVIPIRSMPTTCVL